MIYDRAYLYASTGFLLCLSLLTYLWWGAVEHLGYLIVNVDTFSHGQVVPLVSLALIWSRRSQIKQEDVFIWMPAILILLATSMVWLVGEVFDVKIAGHVAFVTAVQALILLFFGPIVYQKLLFPLLFLYLAVPIGHDLIPVMQDITARMSVSLLSLLGVSYEADGLLITLSSGVYEVAEACAGVRFLFTSMVTGVLLAHLIYHDWKKRMLIVLAAAAIPIFANVLRVLGILLISEATDQSFAREVDHVIYGWVFLSIILVMLISVAYKFADEPSTEMKGSSVWFLVRKPLEQWQSLAAPFAVLLILAAATAVAPKHQTGPVAVMSELIAPECTDCAVRKLPDYGNTQYALFSGADAEFHALYRVAADQINVSAALYCPQRPGSELIQIGNVPGGKAWLREKQHGVRYVNGAPFLVETYKRGAAQKLSWSSYYVGGGWHASTSAIKWASAKERLVDGVSAGAALVVSAKIYDTETLPHKAIEKLLSTFPSDSFLWEEIKPSAEGLSVCAE